MDDNNVNINQNVGEQVTSPVQSMPAMSVEQPVIEPVAPVVSEVVTRKRNVFSWYVQVIKKYFVFKGRSCRAEYWSFYLINFVFALVLGVGLSLANVSTDVSEIVSLVFSCLIFVPTISLSVRRLHDTNKSGLWYLLALVPVIGWIVLLVFFVKKGTVGENKYGV